MAKRQQDGPENLGDFVSKMIEMIKEVKQSPSQRVHGASEEMVVAQGAIFLLAGFETTASALATALCMLAKKPDVQQRIYEEISENVEDASEINYETVQHFKYTEAVVNENLRLHPPLARNSRVCKADVTINGELRDIYVFYG